MSDRFFLFAVPVIIDVGCIITKGAIVYLRLGWGKYGELQPSMEVSA